MKTTFTFGGVPATSRRITLRHNWRTIAIALTCVLVSLDGSVIGAAEPPIIRAGQKFTLEFPRLPPDRRGQLAKMQVRLPNDYNLRGQFPMLVWLSGGKGNHQIGAGSRIGDPDRFVLVGLPYPLGANDPQQRTMVGDFKKIWNYHRAMLSELFERVPNIRSDQIAIAGFSNGAHCIDGYLKMREPTDLFNAFILVEGGGYRSGRYSKQSRGKPALVLWGDRSVHRRMGPRLAGELRRAGTHVTTTVMKDTGHAFPAEFQKVAGEWLHPNSRP